MSILSFLSGFSRLADDGLLGMNRRNIEFVARYNRRSLFPLVDDKLKTKQLALDHDVCVPALLGVIDSQHGVRDLEELLSKAMADGHQGFCMKPAKGSGGKGILVLRIDESGRYCRANGEVFSVEDIQRHASNILAGLFSLGGATDVALLEQCIEIEPSLSSYSHEGVPDIRVIVFRGVPVMAMMRLSCSASKGKANLHQGAVGVGLDVVRGIAVNAVQEDRVITHHPDTAQHLLELQLPDWTQLLHLACVCADMSGLGYLGEDLVVDRDKGPMLLDLNARPGLSIQIANSRGLLPRLHAVEKIKYVDRMTIDARIAFAEQHFAVV